MLQRPHGASIGRLALSSLLILAMVGCAAPRRTAAPLEDRTSAIAAPPAVALPREASPATVDPATLPGAENAGKPGYVTVKPGDTLIRIGLDSGQNWRDIARWNEMDNPNVIEVGQVLRVAPPVVDPNAVATKPVAATKVEARPLETKPPVPGVLPPVTPAASAPPPLAAAPTPAAPAATPPPPVRDGEDDPGWAWPASGPVALPFDEARNKGIAIGGKAGDAVLAAADGRVVYAGSGLRGYGNLVIVKHNATYLTAYAHNQTLLVKEDQAVKRGQKIAEMGSTDADRVQLHFEIRKQGKPVDPIKLLPPR